MFINTAVIPIIVNIGKKNWFGRSGLAIDVFLIVLVINFGPPTVELFSVVHYWKKFLFKYEKWKGKRSKMTQREANKLCEGPDSNISELYATTMLTFAMTIFYTPLIPLLPIVSLFGLIYKYWIEKYLLVRRYKLPEISSEHMALVFSDLIPF
jgi:hypothetical protein